MTRSDVVKWLDSAKRMVLSLLLVAVDVLGRLIRAGWIELGPYVPSAARLFAVGALLGGALVGGLVVDQQAQALLSHPVDQATVLFLWAGALFTWGVAAIMFMVLKTTTALLGSIVYRLTDIANRPMAVSDEPRIRPDDSAAGRTTSPNPPRWRDPGSLSEENSSSFRTYDDEEGALRETLTELRGNGVSEEEIQEMLKEYDRGRGKQAG